MRARYASRVRVRPQRRWLSRGGRLVARWLVLAIAIPLPVAAEWLVTKSGTAIGTEGPWEVKGRSLVFTALGGTLQSVHVDEIDLSMSEQLSENAVADRGLNKLKSGPSVTYKEVNVRYYDYSPLGVMITDYSASVPVASSPAAKCVSARIVGIYADAGVEGFLQIGTTLSRFKLLGLAWADAEALEQMLSEDRSVCLEQEAGLPKRDEEGRLLGYAWLTDGRELGLELLKAKAARVSDQIFSRRSAYAVAAEATDLN